VEVVQSRARLLNPPFFCRHYLLSTFFPKTSSIPEINKMTRTEPWYLADGSPVIFSFPYPIPSMSSSSDLANTFFHSYSGAKITTRACCLFLFLAETRGILWSFGHKYLVIKYSNLSSCLLTLDPTAHSIFSIEEVFDDVLGYQRFVVS
jgi:hypothetical protein